MDALATPNLSVGLRHSLGTEDRNDGCAPCGQFPIAHSGANVHPRASAEMQTHGERECGARSGTAATPLSRHSCCTSCDRPDDSAHLR